MSNTLALHRHQQLEHLDTHRSALEQQLHLAARDLESRLEDSLCEKHKSFASRHASDSAEELAALERRLHRSFQQATGELKDGWDAKHKRSTRQGDNLLDEFHERINHLEKRASSIPEPTAAERARVWVFTD